MSSGETNDFCDVTFVFLDRDGVINRKPAAGQFITRVEDLELLPGVERAIEALNHSGRKVIVVTNQRGVALGLYSLDDLTRIHVRLLERLAAEGAYLDAIYVCPHDEGQCDCRKPKTGLIEKAFREFPAARATNSVMVGDSLRDILVGRRMGMRTVLVDDAPDSDAADLQGARVLALITVTSLEEFVDRCLCPQQSP
jgi:D-glycero-D-manno-heptose 1,7-bisphosphate phosphatase